MEKISRWFKKLPKAGKIAVVGSILFYGLLMTGFVGAVASTSQTPQQQVAQPQEQRVEEKVEVKEETSTEKIAYKTVTRTTSTLKKGSSKVTTKGVSGERTKTWRVTYTDGVETSRELVSEKVTKQPVAKVVKKGTYVAPKKTVAKNCPNGTYVNSAGNSVCRPYQSPSTPSGATAKCRDGTYSYSQSRRGTCSWHGGVQTWL